MEADRNQLLLNSALENPKCRVQGLCGVQRLNFSWNSRGSSSTYLHGKENSVPIKQWSYTCSHIVSNFFYTGYPTTKEKVRVRQSTGRTEGMAHTSMYVCGTRDT